MFIDNHFKNIEFIKDKKKSIEILSFNNLDTIDDLSNFILNNKNYTDIKEFLMLADVVVEFIEKFNEGDRDNNFIEKYKKQIYELLILLENKIIELYDIKIFYYGKNYHDIIKSDFFKYKYICIKSEKQLKLLLTKKKSKNEYNILFVDNTAIAYKNKYFDEILNISKIIAPMKQLTERLYNKYYKLKYLKNSLKNATNKNIESIVVGNSYSLIGIKETLLEKNTINLSLPSQDLYYSFELAKIAISSNKNIKQCILGISYYLLKYDLSRGMSDYSVDMIENVYYPLLNDIHNSKIENMSLPEVIEDFDVDILLKNIFYLEKIQDYFENQMYMENTEYYNNKYGLKILNFNWMNLSEDYKESLGFNRAKKHNKILKYENTKMEYDKIFIDFIEFMEQRNIELVMVVFPTTKYYSEKILLEFKKEFDDILKYIESKSIRLIDLTKYSDGFDDSYFCDCDHLNEFGAVKSTEYIKSEIE